ncbi:chlorophyll a/b-binding protein domain-containing protein [Tribonema minus]|uniref:Chlorophyll a/b-binding protein domain-containing protein n=1 Tax=Tribonema minus TaxID=303371 RepID=A0A835YPR1_9STRA|nr:chlorophyll a/b-binding protein domain-containing protein [Tribonema minus]
MKACAAALLLAAGANAFVAPNALRAAVPSSSSAMKMSFENEAGVVAPLGYWDPAGFSADGDVEKFNRYRAIEIKHGRVAQLARLHTFVTHFYKFDGLVSAGDGIPSTIPYGFGAIGPWPIAGVAQVLLFCSALEILAPQKEDKAPGDVQPDTGAFPKLEQYDDAGAFEIQTKEINNGRLAMVAWTGATVAAFLTGGQDPIDTLLSKLS